MRFPEGLPWNLFPHSCGIFSDDLTRVKSVDESALIQLSDEAQIDKIFRFNVPRLGILLSQGCQDGLDPLQCWILFARKLIFTDIARVTLLHTLLVSRPPEVLGGDLQSHVAIRLDAVDGFHMSFYVPSHNVRMLKDEPAGCGDARMLKGQAESGDIGDKIEAAFLGNKHGGRIQYGCFHPPCGECGQAIGRGAELDDADVLVRDETDPLQREPGDESRRPIQNG